MPTNTDITIYHKYLDEKEKIHKWKREYVRFAMWQGGFGASIKKGYDKANNVTVYIPCDKNDLTDVEIKTGDIIVKGEIDILIEKESDLKAYTDVFNIQTVIPQEFGSTDMQHIEIGAK